jgi:hypothetical protein
MLLNLQSFKRLLRLLVVHSELLVIREREGRGAVRHLKVDQSIDHVDVGVVDSTRVEVRNLRKDIVLR